MFASRTDPILWVAIREIRLGQENRLYSTAAWSVNRSLLEMSANTASSPFVFVHPLWTHRELLWQFTLRNVELRHKGSHLGLIWAVLSPLSILGLQILVFGYIFKGSFGVLPNETRADYGLGMFLGMSIYQFVAEVITTAPILVVSNSSFVKKVVFPLEIIPAAAVGAAFIHTLISLGLVLLGIAFFGQGLTLGVLWLPAVLVPLVMLCLGMAWFFSALGVFIRDISPLMQFGATALMFGSAVFYSANKIPATAWSVMRFNPVLLAIEVARDGVLWQRNPNFAYVVYLWLFSAIVCGLGYAAFKKMKPAFADVL